MPTTAIPLLIFSDMACSLSLPPLASFACWQGGSTAGPSHYETWAAQDFRSAKALFVPSLKRDIIPSIAWTRPPPEGRMAIHIARREFIGTLGGLAVTKAATDVH
jgi:hypothetical protein